MSFGAWKAGQMKLQTWGFVALFAFLVGTYAAIGTQFSTGYLLWAVLAIVSLVAAGLTNFWFSNRPLFLASIFFFFLALGATLAHVLYARGV